MPGSPRRAERIATAINLGRANTRVRDYADIYTLTGRHSVTHTAAREALLATAAFRGTDVVALSSAIDDLVTLRGATHHAYRAALGPDGTGLPFEFGDIVAAVTAFADPLAEPALPTASWRPATRSWNR